MLANRQNKEEENIAESAFEIISPLQKSNDIREKILTKLVSRISIGQPIQIVLPAFPAKSSNRDKTIGVLPDLGEVLALQNLNNLCLQLKSIYAPGAEILICSDGRVFNDLVLVSDTAVNAYQIGISKIIKDYSLLNLKTFNLDDVFTEHTYSEMRVQLVKSFSKKETLELNLFNGIHRFIFEDRLVLAPRESREKTRQEAKEIAYKVVERSQAWSRLVGEHFPESIRLSIHPQNADSEKIGIRLLPSDDLWRTPWHSVVFIQEGKATLVPRKRAIENGAELKFMNDEYGYFHA